MSAETKALAVVPQETKMTVTSEQMSLARQTVAKDLDDNQFALYCYNCNRLGIHPLDGLLVPIVRNDQGEKRLTFVNTVDLLRSRAAETGDYAGSDDPAFKYEMTGENEQYPSDAYATVWKFVQGEKCGFGATARWEEYYPGEKQGFMWRNKPHVMLGKCAEALALRKAFPKQLAGLYIPEELQKEIERPAAKGQGPSKQQGKQPQKATGDVMCNECRAINGHLPSCKFRKAQEAQVEIDKQQGTQPGLKWLVQVEAIDTRERKAPKNGAVTKYRMLTCINAANENMTLYAWDTKHYERIDKIKQGAKCIFVVKGSESSGKTYYSIEEIVEITGEETPEQEGMFPPDETA